MKTDSKRALVVGGSTGIGLAIARFLAERGETVIVTSRDAGRAREVAAQLGPLHEGLALDLAKPDGIAGQLRGLAPLDHLALVGSERDRNTLANYDIATGTSAVIVKVVGYTAVIKVLMPRFNAGASIVVLGGIARRVGYPGSTSTGLVNGAVSSMAQTFAAELSPTRINALHPGGVADSPAWENAPTPYLETLRSRTASRALVTMANVSHAAAFLFDNPGVNGINLEVDGGFPTF
ncbi:MULTISPECIES: SDR family oxidoreductase [Rhodomicrobium]|uniref:SDR family NAD(P)-dependent oxidoreductase n=1 Tax=Rhodomicrobium TaxID=1068 RepID=UPI000B4C18BA|nr:MULTISPECIES: SDR family oxidoreductase [Rhodomicrobium]